MKASDIAEAVHAKPLAIWNESLLNKEYTAVFATDLMSDALAMIQESPEETVLVTGLCNAQVLRTAEMLDIKLIIFARGKKLRQEDIDAAEGMDCNLFTTDYTLYETCGRLYSKGISAIS
ncbi:MAG: hypothetical protein IJ130_07545 [Solobacterium sp.]|nr:hypothetical protein [Solobacterium sp.]